MATLAMLFSVSAASSGSPLIDSLSALGRTQKAQSGNLTFDSAGRLIVTQNSAPSLVCAVHNNGSSIFHASERMISCSAQGYDTRGGYDEEAYVVLSLPLTAVATEEMMRRGPLEHFIESPDFQKHVRAQNASVPYTFLQALYYLYHLHSEGQPYADPIWQPWAAHHSDARTAQHAIHRWSDEELAMLEEPRYNESGESARLRHDSNARLPCFR